jgi:hypothetical protein
MHKRHGVTVLQGSTAEPLIIEIRREGVAVDLSTVTAIRVRAVEAESGLVKINDALATGDAAGLVTYQWAPADVDTPGMYHATIEIQWVSGLRTRVPAPFFKIEVVSLP